MSVIIIIILIHDVNDQLVLIFAYHVMSPSASEELLSYYYNIDLCDSDNNETSTQRQSQSTMTGRMGYKL